MKKVIVFGGGYIGSVYISNTRNVEVVAVADNFLQGYFCGHKVISPDEILNYEFDSVVICLNDHAINDKETDKVYYQLLEMGIEKSKIELHNVIYLENSDPRVLFLKKYSETVKRYALEGAVAECGVFRGHFAHFISKYFEDKAFYMFDTFDGFDERDIATEPTGGMRSYLCAGLEDDWAKGASEEIALNRCLNKEKVVIKKGYIPETLKGLEDEKFVFVNLDMDLYEPTIKALKWFWSRIVKGGIILCHDYFYMGCPGVTKAVDEFLDEVNAIAVPIGDGLSIAIIPM